MTPQDLTGGTGKMPRTRGTTRQKCQMTINVVDIS